MRRALVLTVMLAAAGCSSSSSEAVSTTTTAPVVMRLSIHALGEVVTWEGNCEVGEVRVTVADAEGTTIAIDTVSPSGEPGEPFEDCTTDPVEVPVPASGIYRVAVSGVGPTQAAWSAEGEFSAAEVTAGLVVTARSPLASSIAPA